jgi:hypothetical protein
MVISVNRLVFLVITFMQVICNYIDLPETNCVSRVCSGTAIL